MTTLSGTVTESLDPTDWVAYAFRADTGALLDKVDVVAGAYSADCGTYTGPCFVTVAPLMGPVWTASTAMTVGDVRIPTDPTADPYFFRVATVDGGNDTYFDSVSLGLRCNGTNDSTTFTDISGYAHTVTANGDAKVSTEQSKYGGASAYFDGTGDYLSVADHTSLTLTNTYTIEFWLYPTSSTGQQLLMAQISSSAWAPVRLDYNAGNLVLLSTTGEGNWDVNSGSIASIATGQWTHIAVVSNETNLRVYKDGTQVYNTSAITPYDSSGALLIGGGNGLLDAYSGYMDDIRITVGVARYSSSFTPPGEIDLGIFPTGTTEPTWPTTPLDTVVDGGVTWECVSRMVQPITQGPLIPA